MNPETISYAKQFRLGILANGQFKPAEGLNNQDFLLELFRAEAKRREEYATAERIKRAAFPAFKDFDSFDTDFQKGISKKELEILAKLEWLETLYNLILIGPPGRTTLCISSKQGIFQENLKIV